MVYIDSKEEENEEEEEEEEEVEVEEDGRFEPRFPYIPLAMISS